MKAWTVGTSTRSLNEFLKLLKQYGIQSVVDVRRFPTSRFEYFRKERLQEILLQNGIEYHHLEGLGGYRGGYQEYMRSVEFAKAFSQLLRIIKKNRTAILCAELLFFRCHRRFISDSLVEQGIRVVHILDGKISYTHRPLE
ncbi:MAG: DUF488 family protein [Thermoplasmata archaeon]